MGEVALFADLLAPVLIRRDAKLLLLLRLVVLLLLGATCFAKRSRALGLGDRVICSDLAIISSSVLECESSVLLERGVATILLLQQDQGPGASSCMHVISKLLHEFHLHVLTFRPLNLEAVRERLYTTSDSNVVDN